MNSVSYFDSAKVQIISEITKKMMLINVNQPHLFLLPCPFYRYPTPTSAYTIHLPKSSIDVINTKAKNVCTKKQNILSNLPIIVNIFLFFFTFRSLFIQIRLNVNLCFILTLQRYKEFLIYANFFS